MADVAIRASATAAAPRDYTIPGAQEILPKAITATFDGTGAASQFFPCLQVLDPGGNVMFSAISSDALSPGGSADVSWFPGLGAGGAGGAASGAWTQVFHFDVPALSTAANIDTVGSTWSNNNNNIFGLVIAQSNSGAHNDWLDLIINNDSLSHYGRTSEWGDQWINTTPGTWNSDANVLDSHGTLGLCGAAGDTLGWGAFQFWIPKVYQSPQDGRIVSTGGYAGLVSGVTGTTQTNYEFASISRLQLFFRSGGRFMAGSSLTLWAV